MSKLSHVLLRLERWLSKNALVGAYKVHVQPVFQYGIPMLVWANETDQFDKEKQQSWLLRVIIRFKNGESYEILLPGENFLFFVNYMTMKLGIK